MDYEDSGNLLIEETYDLWSDRSEPVTITYSFLDIAAFGLPSYYGIGFDKAQTYTKYDGDTASELTNGQKEVFRSILSTSLWGSSFSDVTNIGLQESIHSGDLNTESGDITIHSSNPNIFFEDSPILASTFNVDGASDGTTADVDKSAIVLNRSQEGLLSGFNKGQQAYWAFQHEVAHSLGLAHPTDSDLEDTVYDSQKYTIMSTNVYESIGVFTWGLQILDIFALQSLYGRNYNVRIDDTKYDSSGAFNTLQSNDAFSYTIWDGRGNDTIDASGYDVTAQIDLRQGRFSSIGLDVDGDDIEFDNATTDHGNLAIAFHTVIENAIGTSENDILIGNAWSNRLEGGAGNDRLYGDGEVYDGDRGFTAVDNDNPDGKAPASDNDTFVGGQGDDEIYGGGGSDTADYSQDTGSVSVFIGEDAFLGGDGGFAFDGWGDEDTLRSIENIKGSSYDDNFGVGAPLDEAERTFDGGDGIDRLSYTATDNIFGNDSRMVVDAATGTVNWLNSTDNILNIEKFENVTYLPDLSAGYSFAFGGLEAVYDTDPYAQASQAVITSYAHATQGGEFIIEGRVEAYTNFVDEIAVSVQLVKTLSVDVEIGSVVHQGVADTITFDSTDQNIIDQVQLETGDGNGNVYESYGPTSLYSSTFVGTNFGDDVLLTGLGFDAGIRFISGKGNDVIIADTYLPQANAFDPYSVNVVYTGGTDTITGNIGTLSFAEYITEGQISISGNMVDGYLIGDGVITVAGLGSITINADQFDPTLIAIPTSVVSEYDPMLYSLTVVAQTLTGDGTDNYLFGSFGVDTISGGAGVDTLYGAAGNDTIGGDAGNDEIYGGVGNDTLDGGANADVLYGHSGNDTLNGGTGNDTLDGGLGNDSLNGGDDVDTASYANSGGPIRFYLGLTSAQDTGGAGIDTVSNVENVTGSRYNDVIEGNAGNNDLRGGDGTDTLSYAHAASAVTLSLFAGTVTGGGGSDVIQGFENAIGSAYNDTIVSNSSTNIIDGGAGTDTVSYAGSYGVEVDLSLAGAQNTYGGGTDTLISIENVIGSAYNDVFRGSNGANIMTGGSGYDIFLGSGGADTFDGGADYDEVSYYYASSGIDLNLSTGAVSNDGMGSSDTISGIEGAYGSMFDDVIIGDAANNTLNGNDGDDEVYGGGGHDWLTGAIGNDFVDGGTGDDTIYGFTGNDRIEGGAGTDYIDGGDGIDTASYAGASTGVVVNLSLSAYQNTVGAGSDYLASIENLIGSAGNDGLTGDGADNTIDGGLGDDTLLGGSGSDTLSYRTATAAITVVMSTTSSQNTVNAGYDTISGFENYLGSNFGNTVSGTTGNNIIEGGNGNDTLNGGNGSDTLSYANATAGVTVSLATTLSQSTGGSGSDTISNFENLTGSSFDDNLTGNFANNIIHGGAGNDVIIGGSADDSIVGGEGTDTVSYTDATGAVTVSLAVNTSQNTGNRGNDTISEVENLIGTTSYHDTLTGDGNANRIEGRGGNDTISGGDGNDTLLGGMGVDTLTGGSGADTFFFDTATLSSAKDTITDFSASLGDKLDISSILVGYDPLTSLIENFISFANSGANTNVSVDRDGTGSTYASIQVASLSGVTGLDAETLYASGNIIA